MERLRLKQETLKKAYASFEDIISMTYTKVVRDAAIQRFEYTFEIFYKTIKEHLRVKEGIIVNTPKSIFSEALGSGLVSEEETKSLLEMTDDRNMTSYTYSEETANINKISKCLAEYEGATLIDKKLKGYCELIRIVIGRLDE
ncbi:MAG: nucleotidyltransferase substrate binding protein [Nitrospirae bacterium]|nr:nucleotidyltransferase substrate binding protein [Nitrospirota bacterium]